MFPFDQAALPQLTTRKALIIVDLQKDFLSADGALPVTEPEGLVDRCLELAEGFRAVGDIVWVQSRFESARPIDSDQVIVHDHALSVSKLKTGPSSRLAQNKAGAGTIEPAGPIDPEAFLSHEQPTCVLPSSAGSEMPDSVKKAVQKGDLTLTKTHYSAFEDAHLLRMLRAKMVIEVFICGSLANVGVYATAMGAAGHGMAITIVEDCCGHRSDARQSITVASLIDLTGCEIASCAEVLADIRPKNLKQPPEAGEAARKSDKATDSSASDERSRDSITPDIVGSMSDLRLSLSSQADGPGDSHQKEFSTSSTGKSKPRTKPAAPEGGEDAGHAEKTISKARKPDTSSPAPKKQATVGSVEKAEVPRKDKNMPPIAAAPPVTNSVPTGADAVPDSASDSDGDDGTQNRGLCEGDTDIIENLLPALLEQGVFEKLREEVRWQRMSHQGGEVPRLVAVQGEVAEDGSIPVYRHPSDESPPLLPFTETVLAIKTVTEKHLGHPLNHVLIQYYRDGSDYISEHSDKSLDIVRDSFITNVSLGAERTMVFRTKRMDKDHTRTAPASPENLQRKIQRAQLPHNSVCRMGLKTNMKWLHSIRQDKRAERDKSSAELAFDGGRISLTFRRIGTFLDRDETVIWGQGAIGKSREQAHPVINGQTPEAIAMLRAFGTENHSSSFDWETHYGDGFDVLHLRKAPRFFVSQDAVVNLRIALMLAECGINYAKGSFDSAPPSRIMDSSAKGKQVQPEAVRVKFIDNDASKSAVEGEIAIMLYLDSYKPNLASPPKTELAVRYTRFQQALLLLDKCRHITETKAKDPKASLRLVKQELSIFDGHAAEARGGFLAGAQPSLADFATWPVLHAMVDEYGVGVLNGLDDLKKYYLLMKERENTQKVLDKTSK